MQKRGSSFIVNISLGEIFLMLVSIAAFGFILGEANAVSGQEQPVPNSQILGPPAPGTSAQQQYMGWNFEGIQPKPGSKGTAALIEVDSVSRARLTGTSAISKDSFFTSPSGKKINLLDIKDTSVASNGDLRLLGEGDTIIDTVPNEQVDVFKSGLADKGVSLTSRKKIDFLGLEITGGYAHLFEGLAWSLAVVGAIQLIGGIAGVEQETTNALSIAAFAGIMSYKGLASLGPSGFGLLDKGSFFLNYAPAIGIGVAAVTFVLLYKEESQKIAEFQCLPWEAPLGGSNCEQCNSGGLPCSEYRCKSLGQACELVNPGTDEEKCVWVSRSDVTSPTITPWQDALTDKHTYTSHDTRPPALGTKIIRTDSSNGCIAAFTALEFGLTTNEPSQCKIDTDSQMRFDDMRFFFGENNLFRQNHTQALRLPSPNALAEAAEGDLIIGADGKYDFFVRCRDANGNVNEDAFVFSFCVDPSPDTTPPIIEDTSIVRGSPVAFGSQNIDITAFVNEPAECKWSIDDKAYESMENSMNCSTEVYEQNARQLYECKTSLTGIKDRQENKFYFRCKDQPGKAEEDRNVNTESYEFSLLGSQEINIIDIKPEEGEKIFDSTEIVKVDLELETSNGAEEGKAICYFSPTGDENSFIAMFETNSFKHRQSLQLASGNYNYHFRCVDLGGNADFANVSFSVETDNTAPLITRAYKEGVDSLKIITSEKAECSYSLNDCNFEANTGIMMKILDVDKKTVHFAQWQPGKTYHIKCVDDFGNQPGTNQCSLVAGASNFV